MEKKPIPLTIEKLAGLGDGMGLHGGRKVYVPYTVAGDVVEVKMVRRTTDADYAQVERIITPSADRIYPVCKHFGVCGGCSLQQLAPTYYQEFKQEMARIAVRKAGYDPACVLPLLTFPAASRRRVELHAKAGQLGYYAARSHDVVSLAECKVLEPQLEALVLRIKDYTSSWKTLESVQINALDKGYDVLLVGNNLPAWQHTDDSFITRVSAQYGGKTTTLHQSAEVSLTFGGVKVLPPAGAFIQAVRAAQDAITARVLEATNDAATVLDLFCGLGTYSFPLANRVPNRVKVRAIEGDAAMVQAMREAAAKRKTGEAIDVRRRDLFREPVSARDLARNDAVVINPPRTGAVAQCKELAHTRIPSLVMISCNPSTFTRDAKMLNDAGYALNRVTPIDQFLYSPHLELVAEFSHQ